MNRKKWALMGRGIAVLTMAIAACVFGLGTASAFDKEPDKEPIVGLWLATWTDDSGGASEGTVIVNAWDAWHADGTEAQNDNGPVIIGFVCQGAWKPVGKRTYFLSHPSFNYLGADGHLDTTSSSVIYERVTVSQDGKSFKGTGLIKVFTGIDPFDPSATALYSLPIKISAKRVVPDPAQLH
jgi:hypothetical protein